MVWQHHTFLGIFSKKWRYYTPEIYESSGVRYKVGETFDAEVTLGHPRKNAGFYVFTSLLDAQRYRNFGGVIIKVMCFGIIAKGHITMAYVWKPECIRCNRIKVLGEARK